jgi:MscS family membrane protein
MSELQGFLGQTVGPFTWGELLGALALILGSFVLRAVINNWLVGRVLALASRTATESDDVAARALVTPLSWVLPLVGVYLAFRSLADDDGELQSLTAKIFMVAMTLVVTWTVFKLIDAWSILAIEQSSRSRTPIDNTLVPTLRKALKVFAAVVVFVVVVQNLGYSVSGLLGALGVGGLAVALAAKDTLANLFGGVAILVDRPFRPGDWITLDGADGVVEEIGLRSTRIRTFAKTLVSIPNSSLANATVENHSLMPKRRIKFSVGVTYSTSPDQMRQLVQQIEAYLRSNPDIHQEFLMVKFTQFGASSLDILVYCFTVTTDWVKHLQARQEVQLKVMDLVEAQGLEIAFPTQTVHLAGAAPVEVGESSGN